MYPIKVCELNACNKQMTTVQTHFNITCSLHTAKTELLVHCSLSLPDIICPCPILPRLKSTTQFNYYGQQLNCWRCLRCMRNHTHAHTHTHTHTRTHTHAHTKAHKHAHTDTNTGTHTQAHTQTHTQTHAHEQTHREPHYLNRL